MLSRDGAREHHSNIGLLAMELKEAVERYLDAVKQFGRPMLLSQFGMAKKELEGALSAWEEDYHLHRHFDLLDAATAPAGTAVEIREYSINGLAIVAIVFHPSIRHVLE
jgi:hypothetical protein